MQSDSSLGPYNRSAGHCYHLVTCTGWETGQASGSVGAALLPREIRAHKHMHHVCKRVKAYMRETAQRLHSTGHKCSIWGGVQGCWPHCLPRTCGLGIV